MPIYFDIDKIMSNKKLNNTMKKEIIESFLNKMDNSSYRIGIYGSDTNLNDLNNHLVDITNRSVFLVRDSEEVKYIGNIDITKGLSGEITASKNLSMVTDSNVILPCSAMYIVGENETLHSIALKCGLSEEDLMKYNNVKEVSVGDSLYIPNLYEVIDSNKDLVSYNFGVRKGIDISDYQDTISWDRVSETSDYVIVEVARIKSDTYLDTASEHIQNVITNNIDLGLYMCLGGKEETFYGLSGLGDLIVTCLSENSRNRKAGYLVGQGKSLEETKKEVGMVIESIDNIEVAYELGKLHNIEIPIVETVYKVLYENLDPQEADKN